MTPAEHFARERSELGLTQAGLAEILGVTDRAVRKWESDGPPPWAMLIVCHMGLFGPDAFDKTREALSKALAPQG